MIRLVAGLVLLLVGGGAMATVLLALYGSNDACDAFMFNLGLPGSLLFSVAAQAAIVAGAWLIGTARSLAFKLD
jgi:hypothetical protein